MKTAPGTTIIANGRLLDGTGRPPIADAVVGVVDGRVRVDLPYEEDSRAEVDMNVVMLGGVGEEPRFVEVQGTAEGVAFSRAELDSLLELASGGIATIMALQAEMIAEPPARRPLGR